MIRSLPKTKNLLLIFLTLFFTSAIYFNQVYADDTNIDTETDYVGGSHGGGGATGNPCYLKLSRRTSSCGGGTSWFLIKQKFSHKDEKTGEKVYEPINIKGINETGSTYDFRADPLKTDSCTNYKYVFVHVMKSIYTVDERTKKTRCKQQ